MHGLRHLYQVALIENHLMGGDCLNVGCVPSKALISAARVAHTVRNSEAYGVEVTGYVTVNFGKVRHFNVHYCSSMVL